jgi:hypothetical protein
MCNSPQICSGNSWSWSCFWYLMASFNLDKYPAATRCTVEKRLIQGFAFSDNGAEYIGFPGRGVM